jgi:hypothetical protein
LRELYPAHPCGGLPGTLLIAMAIAVGRRPPLVAAAAEGLGLFLFESVLERAFRGQAA